MFFPAVRLAEHLQHLTPDESAEIAKLAGVSMRLGNRARAGRKIEATPHILLCLAVGMDPATGALINRAPRPSFAIAWTTFRSCLASSRKQRGLDLRSAAKFAGVSAATLSRAENGKAVAIESYLRITEFIPARPEAFLRFTGNRDCNTLISRQSPAATLMQCQSSALSPPFGSAENA